AQGEGSVAIGNQATVNGNARAIAIGQQSKAEGQNVIAIGYSAKAGFQRSVVIGDEATWVTVENKRTSATENGRGQDSVIVGAHAKAARNSTALGSQAEAKAFSATALGSLAKAKGEFSIAIGGGDSDNNAAIANGHAAIAMGRGSRAGEESIVLGRDANATTTKTVVIGSQASASKSHSVVIGANSKSTA
ncbi:hypothetical protein QAA03_10805, partial [Glaesserella parasuis]|nr:hypothetical protein [Glaesserella parasuis]